jgi:hypothetical protein
MCHKTFRYLKELQQGDVLQPESEINAAELSFYLRKEL